MNIKAMLNGPVEPPPPPQQQQQQLQQQAPPSQVANKRSVPVNPMSTIQSPMENGIDYRGHHGHAISSSSSNSQQQSQQSHHNQQSQHQIR